MRCAICAICAIFVPKMMDFVLKMMELGQTFEGLRGVSSRDDALRERWEGRQQRHVLAALLLFSFNH